jgi:hypothetical protein
MAPKISNLIFSLREKYLIMKPILGVKGTMSFVNSIFIICLILACQWELIGGGPRKVHPPPIPYHRKHPPPQHGNNQFKRQHHGKHPSLPPANDFQKGKKIIFIFYFKPSNF